MAIIIRHNWWYYPIGSRASVEYIESVAVIFLLPFGFTCEHIKNHDVINHFSSYWGSLYKYKMEKLSILANYLVESRSTCTSHNSCYVYGRIHGCRNIHNVNTKHVLACSNTISWMATRVGSFVKSHDLMLYTNIFLSQIIYYVEGEVYDIDHKCQIPIQIASFLWFNQHKLLSYLLVKIKNVWCKFWFFLKWPVFVFHKVFSLQTNILGLKWMWECHLLASNSMVLFSHSLKKPRTYMYFTWIMINKIHWLCQWLFFLPC